MVASVPGSSFQWISENCFKGYGFKKEAALFISLVHSACICKVSKPLETSYAAPAPYRIAVHAGGKALQYRCPSKKWASERRWMSELLRLIAYNRKRH